MPPHVRSQQILSDRLLSRKQPTEKTVNWDGDVFSDFEAAVDWPAAAYYEELADKYPNAKIILGVRDPEAWYESVRTSIFMIPTSFPRWIRKAVPSANSFIEMIEKTVWENELNGRFEKRNKR